MSKAKLAALIIAAILILDQISKLWIKLTMFPGQEYMVLGDWFRIHFLENNGMAFGFSFGGEFGKLALSIFRIIAVGFIGYYIYLLSKREVKTSLIVSISMVCAGAAGNIFDSAFYGLIFSEYQKYGEIAQLFPDAGGYASFLHGRVVDMLYFPVIDTYFPEWFPIWGGEHLVFFRPVFNLADTSITLGVVSILLFHRDFLTSDFLPAKEANVPAESGPINQEEGKNE
ncbi:MAG: lipoprotein signal peptidase [Bacteroidales bacterium]|nr:lipoprotein signal peptidase [Bacteroidales bacterium]